MTAQRLFIGFKKAKGSDVTIPVTHTLTVATTGAGKSFMMRSLIKRATTDLGYKIVILDLKDPPDYSPFFPNIKPYISLKTSPAEVMRLLQTTEKMPMNATFPQLTQICHEGDALQLVYERAKIRIDYDYVCRQCDFVTNNPEMKKTHVKKQEHYVDFIHPVVKDKYRTLGELLAGIIKELKQYDWATSIPSVFPVSVMKLTGISVPLQQLVARAVSEWIVKNCTNTILLVDEAHRIFPRNVGSAAKRQFETHIKEGRAKGNFIWASNQDITNIDEVVRKQFQIWILGRQNEMNEAKRVVDQLVEKTDLVWRDVYQLKTGYFIVNDFLATTTVLAYAWPDGVPAQDAYDVAVGKMTVADVTRKLDAQNQKLGKQERIEAEEQMYKEQVEELKRKYDALDLEKSKKDAENASIMRSLATKIKGMEAEINRLKSQTGDPQTVEVAQDPEEPDMADMLIHGEKLKVAITHVEKVRSFDTSTQKGQLMYLLAEDFKGKSANLEEMLTTAAEHGWSIGKNSFSPTMAQLVSEGSAVSIGATNNRRYRLPTKIEFNVKKVDSP